MQPTVPYRNPVGRNEEETTLAELSMDKFSESVINAMGPKTSPRVREVMTALIRHMHEFAREVKLTTPEYLAACDFLVRIG